MVSGLGPLFYANLPGGSTSTKLCHRHHNLRSTFLGVLSQKICGHFILSARFTRQQHSLAFSFPGFFFFLCICLWDVAVGCVFSPDIIKLENLKKEKEKNIVVYILEVYIKHENGPLGLIPCESPF